MREGIPWLVAHRGYAARYPENTLLAIDAAIQAGARFVEFDVLLSADGVPLLFHDRDMQRMCGVTGAVHDYSLAELKTFSVSQFHSFGYRYANNRITTLAELVQVIAGYPDVTIFVEIKRQALEQFGVQTVVEKILHEVAPVKKQAVIISYSEDALAYTRRQSDFPVGAVFDNWRDRKQAWIKELRPEFVFTDIDLLPRFGKLEFPGARLAVYECIDPQKAQKVYQRGVDLVETFAIAEMHKALGSPSE